VTEQRIGKPLAAVGHALHTIVHDEGLDKASQRRKHFVTGDLVWTGFDYLGEPTPYFTARSSYSDVFKPASFRKYRFYMCQARWVAVASCGANHGETSVRTRRHPSTPLLRATKPFVSWKCMTARRKARTSKVCTGTSRYAAGEMQRRQLR
jgi:hypothetical protein